MTSEKQDTYFVKADAEPGGDGSMAKPFRSLSEVPEGAKNVAVAPGTYDGKVIHRAAMVEGVEVGDLGDSVDDLVDGLTPEDVPTIGEEQLLAAIADGSLLIGDFMNVTHTTVEMAVAQARDLNQGDITRAAKKMRKAWNRFQQSYNHLVMLCREFASEDGFDEEDEDYGDEGEGPVGPAE